MWSFAFCPMCDPAFYETQPSFTCWALPSVRPCSLWELAFLWGLPSYAFCETLPLFIMLDPLWDLAFCETLHSVRPCLLWGPASVRARPSSNMWDLASVRLCLCCRCKNVPYVSPCYEWHTLLSVRLCPLWDLPFRETLASVRHCLLWDPGFCEALPSVRPWLCLFYDTLPSVRLCLCLMVSVFCEAVPLRETICETWHLMFCETMPLFQMWNHALCESLLWVTHLAFCETLPSETLPSVRLWLLWGLASLASVRLCLLWDPSFCETLTWLIAWDVR